MLMINPACQNEKTCALCFLGGSKEAISVTWAVLKRLVPRQKQIYRESVIDSN